MLTPILFLYTLSLTVICIGYKRSLKIFKIMTSKRLFDWLKEKIFDLRQLFWSEKKIKDISDIPGPCFVPFIGTKWIYFWRYKMNKIHEAYKDLKRQYGSIVVEKTSTGISVVSLFDRDDIDKVLRYPSKYPFRPPTEIISYYRQTRPDRYCSVGLPNAQGEEWQELRTKLTHSLLNRKTLSAFLPTLNDIVGDFIELIREKRTSDNFIENFQDLANLMSLETVCCLILGRRVGYLTGEMENSKFAVLATAVKRLFVLTRDAYFGNGMWKYLPTRTYKEFVETEETIYDIISELVDETLMKGELECETEDIRTIYLSILQTDIDIRDKKSGIIDFISAGIETFANTLSFLFYYLTKDVSYQDRIYNEFVNCGQKITQENLAEAHFTKACLQESYRLCPTAFGIARILEEDYNLSGYNIKAGTFVLCQTMIACHDEKNFRNATQFVPERWLDCNENQCSMNLASAGAGSSLVLPFGIGRRTCPAKRYIEVELSLIVARILREFRIEFDGELETNFEFLIAPKTPVNIKFIDRY